ncbi:hypothetical protein [Streptomyces sp. NPDC059970]|uniref:hypothetical protein n=1 Tax=Streptomyces sp. NPDC059970 TaxID=3347019 RepID=UPI003683BE4E
MSSLEIPPGPGFLTDVTATPGLHRTDDELTAQLLLIHTQPRRAGETPETIENGMRSLSLALGLAKTDEEPRFIGPRLSLHRGIVSLDYGDDRWVFRIPHTSQEWQRHLTSGGAVRLLLTFTPMPGDRTAAGLTAYLTECVRDGTARWGTTCARRKW